MSKDSLRWGQNIYQKETYVLNVRSRAAVGILRPNFLTLKSLFHSIRVVRNNLSRNGKVQRNLTAVAKIQDRWSCEDNMYKVVWSLLTWFGVAVEANWGWDSIVSPNGWVTVGNKQSDPRRFDALPIINKLVGKRSAYTVVGQETRNKVSPCVSADTEMESSQLSNSQKVLIL